ncbi:MAG: hypothetical protein JWS10_3532 [Cypionkella sp.]|uniref:hypothetical protein n=1 Tax=Cypionkella sp. TaxID=2811411 RepID=UPI002637F1EA|nr:hypothetical protein [Cypionkella sp.]MDB5660917.1 hypothetical protein [Cypionkella sp.]
MFLLSEINVPRRYGMTLKLSCLCLVLSGSVAVADDPMASNNGLYPQPAEYNGPFLVANLNYPAAPVTPGWMLGGGVGKLTTQNAAAYAQAVKTYLEPTLRTLIEDQVSWDPRAAGWYDLVWSGAGEPGSYNGIDPTSGRDAIANTYTGQIMPADTFFPPYTPTADVQNHAVIYYNDVAATMLGAIWKNIYKPDLGAVGFPDGSIVVKAEAVTTTPAQWGVIKGASSWRVFRPSIEDQQAKTQPLVPQVLTVYPIQIAIKIKDPIAAPKTEWVFLAFVYDAKSQGATPWDRFVPVGAMWGNDPEFARDPNGLPAGKVLTESWINPDRPAFTDSSLGWGGRLAGPMDVATRHNVLTPSGRRYEKDDHLRASSCMSCHGVAEFPFTSNLYPSPNKSFPRDGQQFLLYDPGSQDWAHWFQSEPGDKPMSGNIGGQALDYDMAIMFALSENAEAIGQSSFLQERVDGH